MKKTEETLMKGIQDEENQFSIPLQNSTIDIADNTSTSLPRVKLIDIVDFQSKLYRLKVMQKPISKIILSNEK